MNDLIPKYTGKPYLAGLVDCYTLAQDYYLGEFNIELTSYARPYNWDQLSDLNFFTEKFTAEGFEDTEHTAHSVRLGDALLIRLLKNKRVNHVAMYVGGNKILHHLNGRKSEIVEYSDRWRFRVARVLRHPSVQQTFAENSLDKVINNAPLQVQRRFGSSR